MRLTLRAKTAIAFTIVAILGYLLIAAWGSSVIEMQTKNEYIDALYKDAFYLATTYSVNDGTLPKSQMETMAYANGTEIWTIDPDGNVLLFTGNSTPPSAIQNFTPAAFNEGSYVVGSFFGAFSENMLSVIAPLTKSVNVEGYVVLHCPMSVIITKADRSLGSAYITYGAMLLLMIIALLVLDFLVIRPVHKLQQASHEYANGNLSYPMDIRNHDEIGDTAERITEIAHQLGTSSEDQSRFLANISHDFRSPLTSIRGYMVAIEDGTIPPELQGKYIGVVLSETDRLMALANQLLDLTQLEKGIILDRRDFDINDLIRNLLPTFEGRVAKKRLVFNLTFEDENLIVNADRARIEQVLHNLVDNAIKFSDTDSSIDISTSLHGERVFVSVRDHGEGIQKENLNKIWERFYKTDASRGKDKRGTGLGLSIVREIIQAHKETIDVISTPDVGTEFIFTLSQPKE